ncbi:hypothetical protein RDWZM_002849, partial [Blomia tropicalis]
QSMRSRTRPKQKAEFELTFSVSVFVEVRLLRGTTLVNNATHGHVECHHSIVWPLPIVVVMLHAHHY